jgi:hypothetical protein
MFRILTSLIFVIVFSQQVSAQSFRHGEVQTGKQVQAWDSHSGVWVSIEQFWENYGQSRGGITWGEGVDFPPYSEVKEHDTFLFVLESGSCLMEFFHSRWRRANDVKRWDPAFNDYSSCPQVFD